MSKSEKIYVIIHLLYVHENFPLHVSHIPQTFWYMCYMLHQCH